MNEANPSKIKKLWIHATDTAHGSFGYITFMLAYYSYYFLALSGALIFALYQFIDFLDNYQNEEARSEIINDIKEFLAGFMAGFVYVTIQILHLI